MKCLNDIFFCLAESNKLEQTNWIGIKSGNNKKNAWRITWHRIKRFFLRMFAFAVNIRYVIPRRSILKVCNEREHSLSFIKISIIIRCHMTRVDTVALQLHLIDCFFSFPSSLFYHFTDLLIKLFSFIMFDLSINYNRSPIVLNVVKFDLAEYLKELCSSFFLI